MSKLEPWRELLLAPARHYHKRLTMTQKTDVHKNVLWAFAEWAAKTEDTRPRVQGIVARKMQPVRRTKTGTKRKSSRPLPSDLVGLSLELFFRKHPQFRRVLDAYGFAPVFATIGIRYGGDAELGSLITLNRFLVESLIVGLEGNREMAKEAQLKLSNQLRGLDAGRHRSSQARAERAQTAHAKVNRMTCDYVSRYPGATHAELLDHLESRTPYKRSYLAKLTKGAKRRVLRAQ